MPIKKLADLDKSSADLSFDDWMNKLDDICYDRYGVSIHDLPDMPFMDWYEDGIKPSGAATRAYKELKNEGY